MTNRESLVRVHGLICSQKTQNRRVERAWRFPIGRVADGSEGRELVVRQMTGDHFLHRRGRIEIGLSGDKQYRHGQDLERGPIHLGSGRLIVAALLGDRLFRQGREARGALGMGGAIGGPEFQKRGRRRALDAGDVKTGLHGAPVVFVRRENRSRQDQAGDALGKPARETQRRDAAGSRAQEVRVINPQGLHQSGEIFDRRAGRVGGAGLRRVMTAPGVTNDPIPGFGEDIALMFPDLGPLRGGMA